MKLSTTSLGFTLIELLMVVTIIILTTGFIMILLDPVESAKKNRDYQRLTDLQTLSQAIESFYTDNNRTYPDVGAKTTTRKSNVLPTGNTGPFAKVNGNGWIDADFGDRLPMLNVDPLNTGCNIYRYRVSANGYYFKLDTILEYYTSKMANSSDGGTDASHYEMGNDPAGSPISMGNCP